MNKSGIYCIRNILTDKRYVGQSIEIEVRLSAHSSSLRKGSHYNSHLQRSWNKYGEDCFEAVILENAPREMLDFKEDYWITHFNSINPKYGYNRKTGGANGSPTAEARKRASISLMGHSVSEETRIKIGRNSERRKGWKHTEEAKRKISEAHKGKPTWIKGKHHSDETRAKLSRAKMGVKLTLEHRVLLLKIHNTPEVRERHRIAATGKKVSDDTKKKLSIINKGKKKPPRSPEHCAKISAWRTGRKFSTEVRAKMSSDRMGKPWSESRRIKFEAKKALLMRAGM